MEMILDSSADIISLTSEEAYKMVGETWTTEAIIEHLAILLKKHNS